MDDRIGIRELKNKLSAILRRVKAGETVIVTDRNEPFAVILPAGREDVEATARRLAAGGRVSWSGGKPTGLRRAPKVEASPASDAVVEDRR